MSNGADIDSFIFGVMVGAVLTALWWANSQARKWWRDFERKRWRIDEDNRRLREYLGKPYGGGGDNHGS
jgi:hypothetical protein